MIMYAFNPHASIDLLPLSPFETMNLGATHRSEFIFKLHEITKFNIVKMNTKYRIVGSKG